MIYIIIDLLFIKWICIRNVYTCINFICTVYYSQNILGGNTMPSYKYVIELTDADRAELNDVISKGTSPARTILRANILLASDRNSKKYMTVAEIADVYHTTPTTVQTVRTSYCEKGLAATLARKKRETPPVPAKVTGDIEARIIALACGTPPEGYAKWTLRLLADRTVELGYVKDISHVTVSRILKKTNLSLT